MKRIAVLLFCLVALSFSSFAQANGSSDITNFALDWGVNSANSVLPLPETAYSYLYPETAYRYNPSVLTDVRRVYIMPHVYLSANHNQPTYTRRDATIGALGGTETTTSTGRQIVPDATAFMPISSTIFSGISASYTNRGGETTVVDDRYTSATSSITTVSGKSLTSGFSVQPYFAAKLSGLDIGFSPLVVYQNSPGDKVFNTTTDAAANGGKTYYTAGAGASHPTSTNIQLSGTIGARKRTDALDIGLAFNASYRSSDKSSVWYAADTTGNTFADTIVTGQSYYTNTTWGLGNAAYANMDKGTSLSLAVTPSVVYTVSPALKIIGMVQWQPYNTVRTQQYLRTTATDRSDYQEHQTYGLLNLVAVGGIEVVPFGGASLRVGIGYTSSNWENLIAVQTSAAGTSTLTAGNPGYPEFALGAQPDNQVVQNAGNSDAYASNAILLLTGFRWDITPRITVFSRLGATLEFKKIIYRVFNTSDNKVWEEVSPSTDFSLGADPLLGVAVKISDNAIISLSAPSGTGNISVSSQTIGDGIPQTGGTATTTTTIDSTTSRSGDFTVDLNFILGL
jgi:hypothetical protein